MIKTIIFDYAGVLTPTRDNSFFAQQYHKRFGLTPQELMKKTYNNFGKAAIGKISDDQFWNDISRELNVDPDEVKDLIIKTFSIDPRMIEIIDKIKDRYTIIMTSNQLEGWLEKVIDDNNLRDKFHFFVNSYHVGVKKPELKKYVEINGS